MPTTAIHTYTRKKLEPALRADLAVTIPVGMKPAAAATVEYARGTVLGKITATGKYHVYDDAAVDGTQVAVGILEYDISVDTAGNIAFTTTAGSAGEVGEKTASVGMYIGGYFRGEDLKQSGTGSLDAAAIADLQGRWVEGSLTAGLFKF